jgi:hypothetical protein
LLGIPDNITQVALVPVAYFRSVDFKPAIWILPAIEYILERVATSSADYSRASMRCAFCANDDTFGAVFALPVNWLENLQTG